MNWIRWVLSIPLFAMFCWMAVVHAHTFIVGFFRESPSMIPLFGAVFGSLAILIAPWADMHKWWWVPFVVDCGSLPLLLRTAVYAILQSRHT